jgi:hypothetical protein
MATLESIERCEPGKAATCEHLLAKLRPHVAGAEVPARRKTWLGRAAHGG